MQHTLKIGLFGFGCVGKGLFDIFQKTDFSAQIHKICVKDRTKKRELPASYFTYDKDDILENKEINTIVELISDADEAYHIVKKALLNGKNVVTANKKMLALHLEELIQIQQQTNTSLLYEAAACGSIPIIRTLAEYYDNELLFSVSGIFNGSTNYILSKIEKENLSYQNALKEAQELGFAEADPTLDVEAFDPTYKLCLLATQAYGVLVSPKDILRIGIQHLTKEDILFARHQGYKIKLVANLSRVGEHKLALFILPTWINADNTLYNVDFENNAVLVEAAFSDKQTFIGKGAGGHPTASAVLSDISALRYGYRYEYRKIKSNQLLQPTYDLEGTFYLRFSDQAVLDDLDLSQIHEQGEQYVIATLKLSELHHKQDFINQHQIFISLIGEVKEIEKSSANVLSSFA